MTDQTHAGLGIEEIIGDKREAILRLAAQYGATNVRVFGSVARGEARPDSDVDFIVTMPERTSIFDMVGLWLDLTEIMDREVDLIADHPEGGRVMREAIREGVPL